MATSRQRADRIDELVGRVRDGFGAEGYDISGASRALDELSAELAASQERVAELSSENAGLRSDLASVCVWLCDWDEGIEAGNAVALAKHVKEVCKERGHGLTEQRARAETAARERDEAVARAGEAKDRIRDQSALREAARNACSTMGCYCEEGDPVGSCAMCRLGLIVAVVEDQHAARPDPEE